MENNEPSTFKSALNAGAILGLVLMIVSLSQNIMEMYDSKVFQYLSYAILIGGLIIAVRHFRDKELGGFISYGKIVGYGTLTALFAGIVGGFMIYLYLKFVDDSMITFIYEKAELDMYNKNLSDEQIATSMKYMKMFTSAGMIAIMAIISNAFFGFIISLIAGIFMKNEQESFPVE